MYKLDGHTRAYLWKEGKLLPPPTVQVDVYEVSSLAEVISLYDTFDATIAAENAADKVAGAVRLSGISCPTLTISRSGASTGIKLACAALDIPNFQKIDIRRAVELWSKELGVFANANYHPRYFKAGVLTAALITIRKYECGALDFWDKVSKNEGGKNSDP